ncbi:MAG: glycerophosphodiester phosphodiesterase [Armatimonadota bacterium]
MPTGCCAHRGVPVTHPENTLPSFERAIELGVDMIEFDVRQTADGEAVVMHDDTVDRTTDGTGAVSEMKLRDLKRLDAGSWKDPEFEGTEIPTFAETLATMPADMWLNIELKAGENIVELVIQELQNRHRIGQALLAANNAQAERARELVSDIQIINMARQSEPDAYIANTIETRSEYIQLRRRDATESRIQRCHEHGIVVNIFKSDEPDDQRTLINWGVDYILTDDAEVLLNTLGRS